jgi:hypothetical protein
MISLIKKDTVKIKAGVYAKKLDDGFYEVNGYLIDAMNKQYIMVEKIRQIDQYGVPHYHQESSSNPAYRGDYFTTSKSLAIMSLIMGFIFSFSF